MPPLFSVVIPTYNQADFLRISLRSILDQTCQDFEVIVINNYSGDHTLDVIQEVGDSRIRSINFKNSGVIGASRNVGIKAAEGRYVAFLDSDDAWYSNKLAKVAKVIASEPDIGLVCHDQDIYRDGEKSNVARTGPKPGHSDSVYNYLLLISNCISTSSAVVKRSKLVEVEYFSEDPEIVTLEDYDLWLRLSQNCSFHFIHEVLGLYNYHSEGASAKVELHLKNFLTVLGKHAEESPLSNQPGFDKAIRGRYAGAFYGAARQYHRSGAAKRAFRYYAQAIRTDPRHRRAYAALTLLGVDLILGQTRRRKVLRAIRPGSWLASWLIS
jgi:glycosyltransferase involved in cell wall biosynthesis